MFKTKMEMYTTIKNNIINQLKEKIKLIEEAYTLNFATNTNLLKYVTSILKVTEIFKNYNIFHVMRNYHNISNFNYKDYKSYTNSYPPLSLENQINNLLLYYKHDYLITINNFVLNKSIYNDNYDYKDIILLQNGLLSQVIIAIL